MSSNRIGLCDTTMDAIIKMSEGNPGCLTFLLNSLKDNNVDGFGIMLSLDTLELYGSEAYMLWNDCCDRNLLEVRKVLKAWQIGNLTKEAIHENLAGGRGTPFNLKEMPTVTEVFDGIVTEFQKSLTTNEGE